MSDKDKIEILNEIADNIRRINSKVLLFSLLNQAKEEFEKCDFTSGRKSLIQAYLINKKNADILRGLGCIKQHEKKYNSAIRYYKTALKYSKKKEVEYTLIGIVLYYQNRFDEALEYFNLAIDENNDYDSAYEGRNQTLLERHLKIIDLQETLKKHL